MALSAGGELWAQSIYATPYTFTTLAGKARAYGTADGTAIKARFRSVHSVVVDKAGNVYVADTNAATIRKITPHGVVTTFAGQADSVGNTDGTGSEARFYGPTGLALDAAGTLYVADYPGHTIRKITPAGVVTTFAGMAGSRGRLDGKGTHAQFFTPNQLAVDGAGNLYVADSESHTILKITPDGVVGTFAGKAGSHGSEDGTGEEARFYSPRGLAVDGAGNVYVADCMNDTIRKITPGGVVTTLAGQAESQRKEPAMGRTSLADGPVSGARFAAPSDIAIDKAGNLYVADSVNRTIRKITTDGMVTTLAGKAGYVLTVLGGAQAAYGGIQRDDEARDGRPDPDGSGTGGGAWFGLPVGLAIDRAGVIYVGDNGFNTIRKGVPAAPGQH